MAEDEAGIFAACGVGLVVVECDSAFTVKRCNAAFARLLGYETLPKEVDSLNKILAPGGFAALAAAFPPDPIDTPIQFETAVRMQNGEIWHVHLSVSMLGTSALCCFTDIDARKKRELELTRKLAEDEMRFNQSKIFTGIYRVATRELLLSHRAAELFGLPRNSKNYPYNTELVKSNSKKSRQYIDFFEKIINGEPSGKASTVLQLGDGTSRLFNLRFKTVFNHDGTPSHGVISLIDITEDRERLLASEKWNVTNESLKSDYIHYYDYNLTIDALETIKGSRPSVYPAQNERTFTGVANYISKHIVHPDDREEYMRVFSREELLKKYEQNERRIVLEHRRLKPDNTYMRAQAILQLSRDPFNSDILCLVLINDLDAAMGRIRDKMTTEIYNLVTDTIPGAIILTMHEEGYPYYHLNDGVYSLTKCPPDHFNSWSEGLAVNLIHPDDRESTIKVMERAIADNTTFDCKCRILKYDGSVGWVMLRGKKGQAPEGYEVIHSVLVDITEIVSLQDALHEAVANAQAANKTKTVFLANMSHEIRTPMNGIIGLSEILLSDSSLPKKTQKFVRQIHASAASLLDIINDILDISKIESGKMEIETIDFKLSSVLKDCETFSRFKAEDKGIDLRFVADSCIDTALRGDPTKLRQILHNLLSNAVKFTDHGTVALTIKSLEEENGRHRVRFEVTDTGIGMTGEQARKVFDPFVQADSSTTRRFGGTGLGLSITKNIIDLMGGRLEVDSKKGKGSRFAFELVFEPGDDSSLQAEAPEKNSQMMPRFAGDVLVCEDNSINQQVILEHLARVGLKAVLADNGRKGVDLAVRRQREGNPFKLIFMDIHMPVLDGVDATAELQKQGVTTPIFALTANAMTWDREKYLKAGMSDYIAKPFESGELWKCLLRHLEPLSMTPVNELRNRTGEVLTGKALGHTEGSVVRQDLGLQHSGGNRELYSRLKQEFVRENGKTFSGLTAAVRTGDRALAHRIAHSLKSSAAQIGAVGLAESAGMVEELLRNELRGQGEVGWQNFERSLAGLGEALQDVLKELGTSVRDNLTRLFSVGGDGVGRGTALALLGNLEPLLESGDTECTAYLPMIREVFSPIGDLGERLYNEIDGFDFDLASITVREIRAHLEKRGTPPDSAERR